MRSFRSFSGVEMNLDSPRVLLAGLNGSGKSSVAHAIRWALTGRCEGTDARGAGAEVLIPTNTKTAEVAVTVEGIGCVARTYAERGGGAFSVEGFTGTSQIQQQALMIKLETTPEFLDAVMDTSIFLDLTHIEAKAMVLSLLGVKFTLPSGPNITVDYTLDELDVRYKQAFEDRKLAKKALAQCVLPPKPAAAQMPTIEAIETQLAKLRTVLGALRQETGAVSGRRTALQDEQARVQAVIDVPVGEDLSSQIDALQVELTALEAVVAPVQAPAPAKGDPQRLSFLRSQAVALEAHVPSAGCVLNPKVACLTPSKQFQMAVGDVRAEMLTLVPLMASAKPQAPAESPLTALRRQIEELTRQHARWLNATLDMQKATQRMHAIRQELDALPSTATQDAEIQTTEGRIAKGEQLLKEARNYWHDLGYYDQSVQNHKMLKAEVDRLETLVEQLGPNGVRVPALKAALGTFEAAVNPYVEPFGWTITFSVEPWGVFANGRPVETYSESERFLIGLSLQLWIAMLSGLKFAIVDRIDMLTAANRALVTKMLLLAPLDQILILGSREDSQALPNTDPEKPKIKGLLSYRLGTEQGQSVILERSAA